MKYGAVETSGVSSGLVSYPDPVFSGGELEVPVNPEDDAKVQLHSLTQTEKDALLTYGDLDPEDPETAEALQKIQNLLDGYNKRVSFCAYASRAIAYNCEEKYSHKSGDNFGKNAVCNDGAIVWADRPYVVAILNASEGEPADEALVGNIVKCINDKLMK